MTHLQVRRKHQVYIYNIIIISVCLYLLSVVECLVWFMFHCPRFVTICLAYVTAFLIWAVDT